MPLVYLDTLAELDGQNLTDRQIGILPVAATEAHGPHLPISTDCDIARGHLRALGAHISDSVDALVLPIEAVGASLEHSHFPQTRSREVEDLIGAWFSIAGKFARAGGRRLVIVSSHGGNTPVVDAVILKARARLNMLAVGTAWMRFGYPEGLFDQTERRYGVHGGDIETSLMLHYAPEKVALDRAEAFASRLQDWDRQSHHLSAYGRHRFGWMSTDLNPHGVVGNAKNATAEKGAALARHQLGGFAELLEDVAAFDLRRFAHKKDET